MKLLLLFTLLGCAERAPLQPAGKPKHPQPVLESEAVLIVAPEGTGCLPYFSATPTDDGRVLFLFFRPC